MKQHLVKRSRFLSLVLRHDPRAAQLELDSEGWADIEQLLEGCKLARKSVTRDELEEIVETNNKRRFAFSECGTKIRASQGHSLEVDLAMDELEPPFELFHGTASRFLDSIRQEGLKKMNRQHVHLSSDESTAIQVGWLTDSVPTKYISF